MTDKLKQVHWIKWRTKETIYGSFMIESINSLGFMVKLCCLSAETRYPGYLQAEPNKGIPHIQIAGMLNIPLSDFDDLLGDAINKGRIEESEDGVIKIINWDKYQSIKSWNGNGVKENKIPVSCDTGNKFMKGKFGKTVVDS